MTTEKFNTIPAFEFKAAVRVEAKTTLGVGKASTEEVRQEMQDFFLGLQRYCEMAGYDVGAGRLSISRELCKPGSPVGLRMLLVEIPTVEAPAVSDDAEKTQSG